MEKKNKENYFKGFRKSPKHFDTLYINANTVVIKDMSLGIEIDLKGKINQFNKIIVDGITFVKEN